MTKETLTMNESNWSGKEIEVTFYSTPTVGDVFTVNGEDYVLGPVQGMDGMEYRDVIWESAGDSYVCRVHRYSDGTWGADSMGVARESSDPRVVAVQMICNII